MRPITVLAVILWAGVAWGDLINPVPTLNIRDDQVDDIAVTDPGGIYASVGLLRSSGSVRSGTLIGARWVLTAAHVGPTSPDAYTFEIGGQIYTSAEVIKEPTWSGSLYAGNDIALVRLEAPVENVTPARLFDGSLSELGQVGTMVGYGSRGTGSAPNTLPQGTRHIGRNIIDATGDMIDQGSDPAYSERILFTDFDDPLNPAESLLGSAGAIDLESNVAGGDSGGALFADFGYGNVLVGVISFLGHEDGTANGDYGDASGFTRVADHLAFIETQSGITPASVPEPTSWLLLGTVLSLSILGRSRHRQYMASLGRQPEGSC